MNVNSYKTLIFLSFWFLCLSGYSQRDSLTDLKISANYFYGNILPEFGLLDSIAEKPLQTFEISILKQSKKHSIDGQFYNYPEYGVALFYTDLGEKQVLGEIVGVDYFFKINLIESNNLKFFTRAGFGVNYTSKKYHPKDNPYNVSIGSNINAHFNLRLGFNSRLSKTTFFNLGASFDHISNAATQFPNLGVNYVSLFGGLTQEIGGKHSKEIVELPAHISNWEKSITAYFGARHLKFPSDRYYFVPALSFSITHKTFRVLYFGVGTDLFYDNSVEPRLSNNNVDFQTKDAFSVGVHANQTLKYNNFSFTLQEGIYVFKTPGNPEKRMYNRAIFSYNISKLLSLKMALRTYLHDLRYVEPGIVIRW